MHIGADENPKHGQPHMIRSRSASVRRLQRSLHPRRNGPASWGTVKTIRNQRSVHILANCLKRRGSFRPLASPAEYLLARRICHKNQVSDGVAALCPRNSCGSLKVAPKPDVSPPVRLDHSDHPPRPTTCRHRPCGAQRACFLANPWVGVTCPLGLNSIMALVSFVLLSTYRGAPQPKPEGKPPMTYLPPNPISSAS